MVVEQLKTINIVNLQYDKLSHALSYKTNMKTLNLDLKTKDKTSF